MMKIQGCYYSLKIVDPQNKCYKKPPNWKVTRVINYENLWS